MSVKTLLKRELALSFSESGSTLSALGFFAASLTLFTFALGVEVQHQTIGALLSVLMMFATLLALSHVFERDAADGTLEQLCLLPLAPEALAACKWLSLWIGLQAPLILAAAFTLLLQGQEITLQWCINTALLACVLCSVGVLAAALALLSGKPALVRTLIALPLMMPPLIFSTLDGGTLWLAAMALAFTPISILAAAASIVEQ